MIPVIPASASALMSAAARAAHSLVDDPPHLWTDETALRLCRSVDPTPLDFQLGNPTEPVLAAARVSACTRSRFAAGRLAAGDFSQLVLLGAGLDHPGGEQSESTLTFAVDLPEVLTWRAELYGATGLIDACVPVPFDLQRRGLSAELSKAGFDPTEPTLVAWLGATMYLRSDAVRRVLAEIGELAPGSELVFDHILPSQDRDDAGQRYATALGVALGKAEPWVCTPRPAEVTGWLTGTGWLEEMSCAEADAVPEGFWERHDSLRPMRLVHLVAAVRR